MYRNGAFLTKEARQQQEENQNSTLGMAARAGIGAGALGGGQMLLDAKSHMNKAKKISTAIENQVQKIGDTANHNYSINKDFFQKLQKAVDTVESKDINQLFQGQTNKNGTQIKGKSLNNVFKLINKMQYDDFGDKVDNLKNLSDQDKSNLKLLKSGFQNDGLIDMYKNTKDKQNLAKAFGKESYNKLMDSYIIPSENQLKTIKDNRLTEVQKKALPLNNPSMSQEVIEAYSPIKEKKLDQKILPNISKIKPKHLAMGGLGATLSVLRDFGQKQD